MSEATVVVVSWNGRHLLPACLDALLPQRPAAVWVVDNGSVDGTADWLATAYPSVRVLRSPTNLGFAGGNNLALREVATEFAVLLNNDAVPRPGWLAALLAGFDAPEVAAVASKVLLPDGTINSIGGRVDRDGYGHDIGLRATDDGSYDVAANVLVAPGTACALRTAALHDVGGFDDDYFLYYEDVDLCWRLRLAGWRVRTAPAAVVDHLHSATTGTVSDLHAFHDTRNRLLTLTKDATAGLALREVLRFPLTTASIAVHEDRHRARVRMRAYASYLRLLPRTLRKRRRSGATAQVSRADVQRLVGRV
jgi:GT2 family glycosyltransferase